MLTRKEKVKMMQRAPEKAWKVVGRKSPFQAERELKTAHGNGLNWVGNGRATSPDLRKNA